MKTLIKYSFFITFVIIAITVNAGINYTSVDTTVFAPDSLEGTNYYSIDLNGDQVVDFRIGAEFYLSYEGYHPPYKTYMIVADSTGLNRVSFGPYHDGDTINGGLSYDYMNIIFGFLPGFGLTGQWSYEMYTEQAYAYLGVQLAINNDVYYGWIRLRPDYGSLHVSGFAWRDEPGMPIIAGQVD